MLWFFWSVYVRLTKLKAGVAALAARAEATRVWGGLAAARIRADCRVSLPSVRRFFSGDLPRSVSYGLRSCP